MSGAGDPKADGRAHDDALDETVVDDAAADPRAGRVPEVEPVTDWVQVANEFTTTRVRKVLTRNGERIQVESRKLGTSILLDPLELEALTWQTPETFSEMLSDPYGPEDVEPLPLSALLSDASGATLPDDEA